MADVKTLQTRIALKYDSYENWTKDQPSGSTVGKNLVLLAGEIGICEIPSANGDSNVAPTVLFKVGNGTKKFHELPWASAKAADVYSWAKAETVELNGTAIEFKTGSTVVKSIDLKDFATDAEVKAITDPIKSDIANIKESLGGTGSVGADITAIKGRLDVIEGDDEGSIAKAAAETLASAETYADGKASAAETAAKTHANTEIAKDRERLTAIEGVNTNQGAAISANETAIANEKSARETAVSNEATARANADDAINAKIGGSYSSSATVHAAIVDAKKAGTDAATAVDNLSKGQVATNKTDIATNKSDIADLKTGLANETSAREAADEALDERLGKIEVFFDGANADGEDKNALYDALDTLTEIQKYITDEGAAADEMVKDIQANANAITALQNIVKDGGTLEKRVDAVEAKATEHDADIEALKNVTSGYTGAGAIQAAIKAAADKGQEGINDAATAQAAAEAAQGTANTVKAAVEHATTGLAKTKEIADKAASDVSALGTRVTTAEGKITTIEGIVSTGADANSKLRTDIKNLQDLTGDASKGNAKLRSDLDAVAGAVNNTTTGLAKTYEIADAAKTQANTNKTDIADIKADYLKEADLFIFNCGSATTVVH